MGRGDRKTRRGKISKASNGNSRLRPKTVLNNRKRAAAASKKR